MAGGLHYFWLGADAETGSARYSVGKVFAEPCAAILAANGECFCLIDPSDCVGGLPTALARAQDIADMFNGASR